MKLPNSLKKKMQKLSLAAMGLLVGCSTQLPFANGVAPNQHFLRKFNPRAFKAQATFNPTLKNSFMRGRQFMMTGETVVKVSYKNQAQVNQLHDLGMDIWMVTSKHVLGQVDNQTFDRIQKSNLKLELISPQRGMTPRNSYDPKYHDVEELNAELKRLAAEYPQIAKLQDFGDSWEKTQGKANRDLWIMNITGKGNGASKPGIVFFGNHHARELATVEIPLLLIKHLLENYGKDPQITKLVDTRDIWIAPQINPDGHKHAEKGKSWRKNTRGGYGVDLNRNYGYKWNTGGSSSWKRSQTYHGGAPFTEPETQAVRDFLTSHKNLKVMMSYHSFSNLILWPWGWTSEDAPDADKLTAIGTKLASFNGYKPQQASDLYVASGITDDYSYGELGMMSFTTEIGSWGDGFDPPYSKIPQFWRENRPGALYLIDLVGSL